MDLSTVLGNDALHDPAALHGTGDAETDPAGFRALLPDQVAEHLVAVHEIQNEPPTRPQGCRGSDQGSLVIARRFEIAQAGEQADHQIEALAGKRLPDVVYNESSARCRLSGISDALRGDIDARYVAPLLDEPTRMAATATGHVKYVDNGPRLQLLQDHTDPCMRIVLIAVTIEQLVVGCAEPGPVPGHAQWEKAVECTLPHAARWNWEG